MREVSRKGKARRKKKSSVFRFFGKLILSLLGILTVLSFLGFFFFVRPELNRLRRIANEKLAGSNLKDLTIRYYSFRLRGKDFGNHQCRTFCV